MPRPTFEESEELWEHDGIMRDIYIAPTTSADWALFLELVPYYTHRYQCDDTVMALPGHASIVANRESSHRLTIVIEDVWVCCHFFAIDDLELTVDPRAVETAVQHDGLLRFVERLALVLQKTAAFTVESHPAGKYLSYDPVRREWTQHGEFDVEG